MQNFAMFSLVSIVPGISLLLCAIPMFFYKISGKYKTEMLSELDTQRRAKGIIVDDEGDTAVELEEIKAEKSKKKKR